MLSVRVLPKQPNAFQNRVLYGYGHFKLQSTISSTQKLLLSIMHADAGLFWGCNHDHVPVDSFEASSLYIWRHYRKKLLVHQLLQPFAEMRFHTPLVLIEQLNYKS